MGSSVNDSRPVCIVTGAASGVGAATALFLARQGYSVAVNHRKGREEAAERVVEDCRREGVEAIAVDADVALDGDCRRLAAATLDRFGRIDALVNSAATTQFVSMQDLDALNAPDFERVFAVNTIGAYQMVRAVSEPIKRASGAIVNVSSIAGSTGTGSSYAYAASKGALNSLTVALARNLAPQVRVNAVVPGMIEGRWLRDGLGEKAYERTRLEFIKGSALGRVCTAADVAGVIGWLIVGTTVITGQLLVVDAGASLGKPPAVER
jgi:3-oxoacyl-[acyl-carrier protein] reductase